MEFAVNGRPLEPSQALAAQGILDQYGNLISYYCKENCKYQVCDNWASKDEIIVLKAPKILSVLCGFEF